MTEISAQTAINSRENTHEWSADDAYSYTIGDVEYKEVTDFQTNKQKRFLFALTSWPRRKKKKEALPLRKIFVSFRVKRISDIDSMEEQFRAKFHIHFNWLPTYNEYMSYCNTPSEEIYRWEPRWYPNIEFMNQIEAICPFPRWEEYPDEGRFRMMKLKNFFSKLCDDNIIYDPNDRNVPLTDRKRIGEFNYKECYFIRAKYDVEILFSESMELQSYPFDCQDFCIKMREKTPGVNIEFIPEMREVIFAKSDRLESVSEFDVHDMVIELGTNEKRYPMIVINFKTSRKWIPVIIDTIFVIFLVNVLSFIVFSIDFQDVGSRLIFTLTLLLTAVLFDTKSTPTPYLTFMSKYILTSYVYLTLVMIENALGAVIDAENEYIMIYIIIGLFLLQHIIFIFYAFKSRMKEKKKFVMGHEQVKAYNQSIRQPQPKLEFKFNLWRKSNGKSIVFFDN